MVAIVQGNKTEETIQVIQTQQKKYGKGKGHQGQHKKKKQLNGKCFNCGGEHLLQECKEWKQMREKLRSSGN